MEHVKLSIQTFDHLRECKAFVDKVAELKDRDADSLENLDTLAEVVCDALEIKERGS